jgi:hypothetical protein
MVTSGPLRAFDEVAGGLVGRVGGVGEADAIAQFVVAEEEVQTAVRGRDGPRLAALLAPCPVRPL